MFDVKETKLRELLNESANQGASSELDVRVQNLARHAADSYRLHRARTTRIRFAVVATGCAFVAFTLVALTPTLVAANTIHKVTQAVDGATSMHLTMRDLRTGSPVISYQAWYQAGSWRFEDRTQSSIWTNGVTYAYTPMANTLTKTKTGKGPFSNQPKGFTMSSMLGGLVDQRSNPDVEKTELNNGTYRLRVDNKPVSERYIFIVDSKTDLPRSMECQKPENGRWVKKMDGTMVFNAQLSPDLFAVKFPEGAKQIDLDTYKDKLAAQLEKTVLTLPMSHGRKLLIHSIEANTRGHVFLTCTGATHGFWDWFDMKDERGVRYIRSDTGNQGNFRDRELDLGAGRVMRYQWWVPTEGVGTFQPHRLTLTFMHQVTHKGAKSDSFTMGTVEELGRVSFNVDKPTTADVPLFLADNVFFDSDAIQRGEAYSLGLYYQSRWMDNQGHPIDDPSISEYSLESGNRRDIRALQMAYATTLKLADLDEAYEKRMGYPTYSGSAYYRLFQICRFLGRIPESDEFLRKAEQSGSYTKASTQAWIDYETRIGGFPKSPLALQ